VRVGSLRAVTIALCRQTRPFVRTGSVLVVALALSALIGISPAGALEPDAEVERVLGLSDDVDWGEYLAGECVTCHAADAATDAEAPRIHGAEAPYLVRAVLDYRGGVRTNTTMGNVAAALGDEEIAALARFLSAAVPVAVDKDAADTDDSAATDSDMSDTDENASMAVAIRPDVARVVVPTSDGEAVVERIQDTANVIAGEFARTSRPCPPFCIQPIRPIDGVETIGELELLAMLEDPDGIVVDSREIDWYLDGTIPGSTHIPYTEIASRLDELGCTREGDAWRCDDAATVALFCNGPWCGQSPTAIRAMVREGYPANRIRYYRGGMQVWQLLGLSVVQGDF